MQPEPTNTQILAQCAAYPDFTGGSAYVRAKILSAVLTKLGQPIPGWTVLRQILGRGSASDIDRGVKDFRLEHAGMLQRMEGLPDGIPENLAVPMRALWQAAQDEAAARFEVEHQELATQRVEAERIVAEALQERDSLAADLSVSTQKVLGLQESLDQERERANTERAAREQAERMADRHIADLTQQRDDMRSAVEANTQELQTLAAHLEGERRRWLMQVEQARQGVELARQEALREGDQKVVKAEAKLRDAMHQQTLDFFRLQKRCSELEAQNAALVEKAESAMRAATASADKPKLIQRPVARRVAGRLGRPKRL